MLHSFSLAVLLLGFGSPESQEAKSPEMISGGITNPSSDDYLQPNGGSDLAGPEKDYPVSGDDPWIGWGGGTNPRVVCVEKCIAAHKACMDAKRPQKECDDNLKKCVDACFGF